MIIRSIAWGCAAALVIWLAFVAATPKAKPVDAAKIVGSAESEVLFESDEDKPIELGSGPVVVPLTPAKGRLPVECPCNPCACVKCGCAR